MDDRHFVVILEKTVAEVFEDGPNSDHAELRQLRCPQRAHAGCPEDMDSVGHGPKDLLVPDRWDAIEIAVDDSDGQWLPNGGPIDVALRNRRQVSCIEF